jgi:hypothetical protein
VWEREITALDDPSLRDEAVGGPDTSLRIKTVWQVRLQPCDDAATQECPELEIDRVLPACLNVLLDTSGYRGAENRLYRLEIHRPGAIGEATFKWSRDNGSVVAAIARIDGRDLTFDDTGSAGEPRFAAGQWVEVGDDEAELDGEPGQLLRIEAVDGSGRTMTLAEAPRPLAPGETGVDPARHPKVSRWDQSGGDDAGERTTDQVTGLEDGIAIQFSAGTLQAGDYWEIPARAHDGTVEWPGGDHPEPQPPSRIDHHRCPLALLEFDAARRRWRCIEDRRRLFGPLGAGG